MSMWTAIVAIVAFGLIAEVIKTSLKAKHKNQDANVSSAKLEELERRIESLESIIIDLEKDRRYRDLT